MSKATCPKFTKTELDSLARLMQPEVESIRKDAEDELILMNSSKLLSDVEVILEDIDDLRHVTVTYFNDSFDAPLERANILKKLKATLIKAKLRNYSPYFPEQVIRDALVIHNTCGKTVFELRSEVLNYFTEQWACG